VQLIHRQVLRLAVVQLLDRRGRGLKSRVRKGWGRCRRRGRRRQLMHRADWTAFAAVADHRRPLFRTPSDFGTAEAGGHLALVPGTASRRPSIVIHHSSRPLAAVLSRLFSQSASLPEAGGRECKLSPSLIDFSQLVKQCAACLPIKKDHQREHVPAVLWSASEARPSCLLTMHSHWRGPQQLSRPQCQRVVQR